MDSAMVTLALGDGNPMLLMTALLVGVVVWMMMSSRGRAKREKEAREKMLGSLSRNDRIETIGGIVGVVTDVKDEEVVIKIDESNNTRMRLRKRAVHRVVPKDADAGDSK